MVMKGEVEKETMYGLFHVNAKTSEVVRFGTKDVLSKSDAEKRALDCRIGQGRGSFYSDGWWTEARALEG